MFQHLSTALLDGVVGEDMGWDGMGWDGMTSMGWGAGASVWSGLNWSELVCAWYWMGCSVVESAAQPSPAQRRWEYEDAQDQFTTQTGGIQFSSSQTGRSVWRQVPRIRYWSGTSMEEDR